MTVNYCAHCDESYEPDDRDHLPQFCSLDCQTEYEREHDAARTASNADYTDLTRAELNGLNGRLTELAHRLARIEDHLRLNGRL